MLAEHMDAESAAFQVGYESPSQFSREYNREFGAPPLRDSTNLRQLTAGQRGQGLIGVEYVALVLLNQLKGAKSNSSAGGNIWLS
jgi:AraC-like DNA-binding protein